MWPSRPAADRSGVRPSRTTRLPAPAPASTTAGRCARTAGGSAALPATVGLAGGRDQRTDVQRHGHAPARTGRQRRQRRASAKRMPLASGPLPRTVACSDSRGSAMSARRRRRGARPRHTARWCCMGRCRRTGTRRPAPCRSRRALHAPRPRPAPPGWRPAGAAAPAAPSAQARSRKARRPASACRVAVISAPGIRARPPPARWRRARGRAAARAGCRAAPSRSVAPSPH